jgi:hypothetical protein
VLEFPARRVQRRSVLGGGLRGIASVLSLESNALTFSPFTFRRRPQDRRELRDRVLRFGLR